MALAIAAAAGVGALVWWWMPAVGLAPSSGRPAAPPASVSAAAAGAGRQHHNPPQPQRAESRAPEAVSDRSAAIPPLPHVAGERERHALTPGEVDPGRPAGATAGLGDTPEIARPPAGEVEARDHGPAARAAGGEGARSAKAEPRQPAPSPPGGAARLKVETRLHAPPQRLSKAARAAALSSPPAALTSPPAAPPLIDKQPRFTPAERADEAYRAALTAMEQDRRREAMSALQDALREEGGHVQARMAMAALLTAEGRLSEAQTVLQEGLAQGADSSELVARLARIMVERGQWEDAASALGQHLSRATYDAEYRALHAGVLQHLGRHAASIQEYRAALAMSPQAGAWWMGLGLSLEAEGRTAEAREALLRARATGSLTAEVDRYLADKLGQLESFR